MAAIWRLPARGLAGSIAAAVALSAAVAIAPPPAAASQTDLAFTSNSTWTADPADARVHVFTVITVKSHARETNGLRAFYNSLEMTLPASSTAATAVSSDGLPRAVTILGQTASGIAVSIALGQRLYAGQTATLVVRFDLVDNGGSTDRDLRIGHNLMSFPVSAFGSPDTPGSSVTVVFPSDFTVQEEFGSLTRAIFGSGEVLFTSGQLDDATSLSAWFTAVQPVPASDFRTRPVTIGQLSVTLRYWADDPGWADAVQNVLAQGFPRLREMIGLGDPASRDLTVIEASSQEIGGFAGAFDETNGQVQVSYLADPFVILHEAAHLWFNDSLAADRWIQEGFASYYAEQAVIALDLVDQAPQLSDRLREAAVPFNDWVTAGVPGSATDLYLYAATLDRASAIANIAGAAGMQKVWREARAGAAAYQPQPGTARESQPGPIDWRRFLDLLELTTGQSFESIWNEWVITSTQVPLLAQRLSAQATYQDVVGLAGSWTLPPEIRRYLDTWQFDQTDNALAQARVVLLERQQIAATSIDEQTAPPPTLQKVFETSTVGAASAEARAELAALNALGGAREAKAASKDAGGGFALIGSDPNADLASAREAFARGDLQAAQTLAQNAQKAWQSGYAAQLVRLLGILAGSLGLLLLLAITLWTLARRPRGLDALAAAAAGISVDAPLSPARGEAAGESSGRRRSGREGELAERLEARKTGGNPDRIPILAMVARGGDRAEEASGAYEDDDGDSGDIGEPDEDDVSGGQRGGSSSSEPGTDYSSADPFGARDLELGGTGGDHEESAYELLKRGQALLRDRHNAQAAVVLERAARVEPGKGSILEALGRAYFNSGQHVRAAETFEALLEVDPSAHYGHFALGLSFARLGRDQEARTHLRLAVALDPSSETYRRALEKFEARTS